MTSRASLQSGWVPILVDMTVSIILLAMCGVGADVTGNDLIFWNAGLGCLPRRADLFSAWEWTDLKKLLPPHTHILVDLLASLMIPLLPLIWTLKGFLFITDTFIITFLPTAELMVIKSICF